MPDPNGRPYLSEKIDGVTITGGATVGSDGGYGIRRAALSGVITAAVGSNVTTFSDAEIAAIAALTSAADRLAYFTGSGTAALATFTAAGRALVDDADATAQRATLGLVIGTNVQAYDAELAALAGLTSEADALPYFTGSGTAAVTTLTTFARSLLDDTTAATARTTLGFADGVWTPTLTGIANVSSSTARQCVYSRVGNTVTCHGQMDVTATAFPTATNIDVSLPIASNLGTAYDLGGTVTQRTEAAFGAGAVEGNATDNRAAVGFFSVIAGSHTVFFSFSYRVI